MVVIGGAVALFGKSGTPAPSAGTPSAAYRPRSGGGRLGSGSDDAPRLLTISAVGFADSSDPVCFRSQCLAHCAAGGTRRDLIEGRRPYVQSGSWPRIMGFCAKLLGRSNEFIEAMVQEDTPRASRDGLVSMTGKGDRACATSRNPSTRCRRKSGWTSSAKQWRSASPCRFHHQRRRWPALALPDYRNALKKIQSFGFRTWSEGRRRQKADFQVVGETGFKRLSVRRSVRTGHRSRGDYVLDYQNASIEDRRRKIYHNTAVPSG